MRGLVDDALPGGASLGARPTLENTGRLLMKVHAPHWSDALGSEGGYGRLLRVELLHKLHDERKYDSPAALRESITRDATEACQWLQAAGVQ